MIKVTNEIREAAAKLLSRCKKANVRDGDMLKRLQDIADGKRKLIDEGWWRETHGDVDRAKIDKIARKADPARGNTEHEVKVAEAMLDKFKARRPPGLKPEPPPLPTGLTEWVRRRKTKTKTAPAQQPSRQLSDSVADAAKDMSDSVAATSDQLKALNEQRTSRRAAKRAGLRCQTCGKPLTARRATARYCNATCRSQAWRAS